MLRSILLRAAFAASLLAMLLQPSVQADTVLAASGPYTLTQSMENDVLSVWQIVADRPLASADREAIQTVDISLFRHAPAWLTGNIRQTHRSLPHLRHMDAAQQAALRQVNLIDIYTQPQNLHMTGAEAAQMQAAIAPYIPIVGVDAASGTVITERDLDAAVAASRFVAKKTNTSPYSPGFRSDLASLARHPASLGPLAERDLNDMERNWAAFQLTWPHESAAYQAQMLGRVLPQMRRSKAKGQGETSLAVATLALGELQYEDYPYALDPRLAAYKRTSDARMSRFRTHMLEYNLLNQERDMHDFARSMNGQGPDPQDRYNPIPLPVP